MFCCIRSTKLEGNPGLEDALLQFNGRLCPHVDISSARHIFGAFLGTGMIPISRSASLGRRVLALWIDIYSNLRY